jgi:hypothetical protein
MPRTSGLARLGLVALLATVPLAGATVLPAAQAQDSSAVTQTKDVTDHGTGDTSPATVKVGKTRSLFDREQLTIDLAGFKGTHNAANTNANGTRTEYPVVVMQCRGANPDRTTCFNPERVQWHAGFDVDALPEQRAVAQKQSSAGDVSPYPGADVYARYAQMSRAEQLPFVAADGMRYLWDTDTNGPNGTPLINEPALKSFAPPDVTGATSATINTRNVPIREDGTNEFLFEVRQKASQPSLGCSDTQACSIVVVPIMDLACAENAPAECGSGPNGPAPGSITSIENHNFFVGAQQWLAESNWRNRFVVPISFAPDLATCDVRDNRPTVPAFGSELVQVAQERWGAAYCTGLRSADYLPVFSQGSEYFARRQLTTRLGADYQQNAVFVTQPVLDPPRPVAHAPSALTGFAVAFVVDDGNGRQVQDMTLSPRLLAKLMTQSYNPTVVVPGQRQLWDGKKPINDAATAAGYYLAHPDLMQNPRSLFTDPEFAALNPGFVLGKDGKEGDVAPHLLRTRNPMIFTIESDVMLEVNRYIAADPAARAWLDGLPDQYGMRVNPVWRGIAPTQLYSLLDTWVRYAAPRQPNWSEGQNTTERRYYVEGAGDTCDEAFRTPYLTKLANVTNSARGAALALLDRRGSATPICSVTNIPVPEDERPDEPRYPGDEVEIDVAVSEVKDVPNEYGIRAQLALTTTGYARQYNLPAARLVNAAGKAVGPTPGTMSGALRAALVDPVAGTIQLDHEKVTGGGYPGTMVSYMAVPTAGLDRQTAARYADYIEFMATTGQRPGATLANLPPGYDPLPPALVRQARDAAAAVREQKGAVPAPPGGPLADGPASVTQPPPAANPGNGLAVTPRGAGRGNPDVDGDPVAVAKKTDDTSSWLARWAIPLMIAFGLLAGLVAFVVQVGSQPGHPLRRAFDGMLRAVGRR